MVKMKDILEEIVATKRDFLVKQKKEVPLEIIKGKIGDIVCPVISMRESLLSSSSGIIAEFKRRSPSKGWIDREADVTTVAKEYEVNGAAAISVLTDTPYFGGNLDDLRTARATTSLPILRKDFIVDEYQLYEAVEAGVNAVLLIAAAIETDTCAHLAAVAKSLRLETLLEVHRPQELEYIDQNIDMIGVNNRNLGTFHTDIKISFQIASMLPKDKLLVSESGISSGLTVKKLRQAGFRGFLIGENFMKTSDRGAALKNFISSISETSGIKL
jgi:indole-3-glycerol phosphate synthase